MYSWKLGKFQQRNFYIGFFRKQLLISLKDLFEVYLENTNYKALYTMKQSLLCEFCFYFLLYMVTYKCTLLTLKL